MTRPGWVPELTVGPDLAQRLIGAQFPELSGEPAICVASGWDNTVYLVGGRWIFRFPRRQAALRCLAAELAVLPELAELPLPVPAPRFAGMPSAEYPWPFWGAPQLPGTELAGSGLPDQSRGPAAIAIGSFLRELHRPGLAATMRTRLPADPNRRGDASYRARLAHEVLARLDRNGIWRADPAIARLLDHAREASAAGQPGAPRPVLCHGDLHARHLLVGRAGQGTGVIDWGDACIADPAIDLSIAYSAFAGRQRADFFAAYGRTPDAMAELRARVLAVFMSAALAEYAAAEGRAAALLAESVSGISRAIAD